MGGDAAVGTWVGTRRWGRGGRDVGGEWGGDAGGDVAVGTRVVTRQWGRGQ
jgi:hypothetical protein